MRFLDGWLIVGIRATRGADFAAQVQLRIVRERKEGVSTSAIVATSGQFCRPDRRRQRDERSVYARTMRSIKPSRPPRMR